MFAYNSGNLSALQRRYLRLFGGAMGLLVALTILSRWMLDSHATAGPTTYVLVFLPAIPVALIMMIAGRYLARETDDFIRMLVMQSLLWAFGITLVVNVVMGGLAAYIPHMGRMLPLFSIDLFCIAAIIALRIQLRRSR